MPFTDCSGLKEIHNPFLLASTVTDGISAPELYIFWLFLFLLPCLIKSKIGNDDIAVCLGCETEHKYLYINLLATD